MTVGVNGPGDDGAPQLLDHDHQLGQPVPRPAMLLGDVQPEPAEVDQIRPERWEVLLGRFEEGAPLAPSVGLQQEGSRRLGQRLVILGNGDRHATPLYYVVLNCGCG